MGCSLALGTKGVASSSCGHVGSQVVRAMGLAPCPTAKPMCLEAPSQHSFTSTGVWLLHLVGLDSLRLCAWG